MSGKYSDLFRPGSDLADLDCSLTDPELRMLYGHEPD